MQKEINKMKDHYIICGCGATGIYILQELIDTGRQVVVIENDAERIEKVKERISGQFSYWIIGDATGDDILLKAGVERAKGLIACAGEDKDNLLITLSAKQLNSMVRVVSRCKDRLMVEKIKKSGADSVVTPNHIGGMRIASEMIRPAAVSFMDIMLRNKDKSLRVEDIEIPGSSLLVGKKISEIDFIGIAGLYPIAIQTSESEWIYNPPPDTRMDAGMKLVIIGNSEQKEKIVKIFDS